MTLTKEEKKQMPATCQKTSLLAVGCNLVLSEDKPGQDARVESSGPCHTSAHAQWVTRHGAGHGGRLGLGSCELVWAEVERAKMCPAPEQETARLMTPPTPGRPPFRTAARDQGGWGERIDCTPVPRSQLQPSARETCTEVNPLLCHYLKTFWTNAHISAEDKLFNSLTMK